VVIDVLPPASAPQIDALSPSTGPARSEVQISGSGLAGSLVEVRFGAKNAQVLSVSDSLLVVRAPKQPKGITSVAVGVVRDGTPSSGMLTFTYTSGGGGRGRKNR
jgi:hypothetical protein